MLPRTTLEQRSGLYSDVEDLISPGFLTHSARIGTTVVHLRTLSPGDIFMLRARAGEGTLHEWRAWTVASSLWMVNGKTYLGQSDAIPFLAEFLLAQPRWVVDFLFYLALGLFSRAQKAVKAVEVYCYESISRYRWLTHGKERFLECSGVPGSATLGRNIVQQVWTAFNTMEDGHIEQMRQWEGFKLVASSNAPKAIAKIDKHDSQRRADEDTRRQREMDLFFYKAIQLIDPSMNLGSQLLSVGGVKTVEDLEEEMRRWVTGEQDHHDLIVTAYKAQIEARHQEQEEQRAEHRRQLAEAREVAEENFSSSLIALTGEQLQELLKSREHRPGMSYLPQASQNQRIYQKYLENAPTSGAIKVEDGQLKAPLNARLAERLPIWRGHGDQ